MSHEEADPAPAPRAEPAKRRRRGTTTREALVRVALELADEVGLEALRVRAVAARASVATMSIYTHFKSKEDLLDAMCTEVALNLFQDSGAATWQEEMRRFCQRAHALLLGHPHWLELFRRPKMRAPWPLRERLLRLMTEDGFSIADAHQALLHAGLLALGFVTVALTFRKPDGSVDLDRRYEIFRCWAEEPEFAQEHPLTHLAAQTLPRLELDERFSRAVEISIRGLEAKRLTA